MSISPQLGLRPRFNPLNNRQNCPSSPKLFTGTVCTVYILLNVNKAVTEHTQGNVFKADTVAAAVLFILREFMAIQGWTAVVTKHYNFTGTSLANLFSSKAYLASKSLLTRISNIQCDHRKSDVFSNSLYLDCRGGGSVSHPWFILELDAIRVVI